MPSSDLTFALAVIGAATGTASTATQIYSTVRDRPRLRLDFGLTSHMSGRRTIFIDVTNVGQRPTTVREVGFFAHPKHIEIVHAGETEPWATGTVDTTFHDGPVFLEAGQSRRFEIVPNIDTFGIHVDFPMRLYAVDIHGRRIWGAAAPIMRMLFGDDPPLRPEDPPDFRALFEPPRPDLRPAKVESRWKIWKRRELRDPSAWRAERKRS